MFSDLGQRFYINHYPHIPQAAFGIAEKAKPGERHADGSKIKDHGWITRKQCQIIEATSQSEEEIKERIKLLIIHKKDTTRQAEKQPALELSQVEQMVRDAVEKALSAVAPAMPESQRETEAHWIARQAAIASSIGNAEPELEPVRAKPKLSGIQMKKRLNKEQYGAILDREIEKWTNRAKILGIGEPIFKKDGRNIDKRWIAQAEKRWQEHLNLETAVKAAQDAPAPAV